MSDWKPKFKKDPVRKNGWCVVNIDTGPTAFVFSRGSHEWYVAGDKDRVYYRTRNQAAIAAKVWNDERQRHDEVRDDARKVQTDLQCVLQLALAHLRNIVGRADLDRQSPDNHGINEFGNKIVRVALAKSYVKAIRPLTKPDVMLKIMNGEGPSILCWNKN